MTNSKCDCGKWGMTTCKCYAETPKGRLKARLEALDILFYWIAMPALVFAVVYSLLYFTV